MRYGLVKSGLDAHTLGLNSLAQLLEECSFAVFIADASICKAIDKITHPPSYSLFENWIIQNHITHLGFSYRLDSQQGLETFGRLVYQIKAHGLLSPAKSSRIKAIYFAGLPETCRLVEKEFKRQFITFRGDETPMETLKKMAVSDDLIPPSIKEKSRYDELRLAFGRSLLEKEKPLSILPGEDYQYSDYGTPRDHLIKRLDYASQYRRLPLIRAHVGPFLPEREKALALFSAWLKQLAQDRHLDIVSVGSSQLSQSHFGEDWGDRPNGGGIPFNSEFELRAIREDAVPMLVRAYSATRDVARNARILEENLNMAWHALSFWWFNQIDGRGPLSVRQGLREHLDALQYIARCGKPFEPNLPHHFAFRGADDITYVTSAYLAARTAKLVGIRYLVLQNMLNTPKSTWGIKDLAKARVLLRLVRSLEDRNFRVIYQPRAGLDYFSPDPEKAKIQLAAVTALMADVEPKREDSPEIIHVVSFSEALFLANPKVINESIRIAKAALQYYPEYRTSNFIRDIISGPELTAATHELWEEARIFLKDMEKNVKDLYSPDGLYLVFKMGYFPVPYLWEGREEFAHAVNWTTKIISGGVAVTDEAGKKMPIKKRLAKIRNLNLDAI